MDEPHPVPPALPAQLVLDASLRIRDGNVAAAALAGRSAGTLVGALPWEALPFGDRATWQEMLAQARGGSESVECAVEHRHTADGYTLRAHQIGDLLIVSLHVTAHAQAAHTPAAHTQAARLTSPSQDERLQRVLAASGATAFDLDLLTSDSYLDSRFGSIFGYADGQAPADWTAYVAHYNADDLAAMRQEAERAMREGSSYECESRITRVDGSEGWVRVSADVQVDANGTPCRSTGTVTDITREKESAAALSEMQRLLNAAQRLAGVGSWSWNVRTGAVTWSEEMFRLQGYDPATVTPSFELVLATAVNDEHRADFMGKVQSALAGSAGYDFEMPMRRTDGEIRLFRARAEIERDASGQPTLMTGTAEDITERRRAEEAFRHSEQELFRAQRMARVGSFTRSMSSGLTSWSPMTRELLEFSADMEPSLDSAMSRLSASDAARYRALVQRAIDSGEPYEMEASTRLPSGRVAVLRLTGEVDRDAQGQAISVHGLLADVTAQREQEQALRISEERFRTVWESSPIGLRLSDARGVTLYVNPRALQMFECTLDEFMSESWRDRLHPDDRARVAAEGRDAVLRQREKKVEYRLLLSDNRVRYLRATVVSVHASDGQFAGHVGALEDRTDEVESALAKERMEQQMHQAQKLESLGVLAGGIAHDFNNLLVGVLTNASLALLELSAEQPAYGIVRDIERAAQRAADLTRQLLAYSGKGRFIVEAVSLSELAVEMTQLLRTVVSKHARLQLDVRHDLPLVHADATQLRQVVMNLITNASDSLGESAGEILLRTRVAHIEDAATNAVMFGGPLSPGPYVLLEVADTGGGMDADTVHRIFDPFFTTKFTGRGLGLAATLGIVRGHDGAVGVRSQPGAGTTVSLYFPIAQAARREPERSRNATPPGHGAILVVDDDDGVRAVARSLLQRQGFDVLLAANGVEGLEQFSEHRSEIRAILLDLTMPVMGGEETLKQLRQVDPDVRVILMSGYSDLDVEGAFVGAGLSGFLQKPFRADDVYHALEVALVRTPLHPEDSR